MRVERIDHAALSVRSFEESARFYEDTLGLERVERPEMGLRGAWYVVGESQLHIIETPVGTDVGRHPAKLNPLASHLALRVTDFEGARDRFRDLGIEMLELGPDGDQFWVRDPDGNTIEFSRR